MRTRCRKMAKYALPTLLFVLSGPVLAASTTVDLYAVNIQGNADKVGRVEIEETAYGLVFTPDLRDLPPGGHGFHIHEKGDCGPAPDAATGGMTPAGAAGGHLDPKGSKRHSWPWDDKGHLGDLPLLYVDAQGNAQTPVLAPRLRSIDEVRDRALMIHAGSDNYADKPKPLGGGGARMACGVIR